MLRAAEELEHRKVADGEAKLIAALGYDVEEDTSD